MIPWPQYLPLWYQNTPYAIAERGPPFRRLVAGLLWSVLQIGLVALAIALLIHFAPEDHPAILLHR